MCTRATEVSATVTSSSQDGLVSAETVKGTVLHIQGDDTNTFSILHDKVESKVFNKEICVVPERLSIECVEDSVSCPVRRRSAAVGLTTLAILEGLATKCTLVNLAVNSPRERYTEVLQLHIPNRQCVVVDKFNN